MARITDRNIKFGKGGNHKEFLGVLRRNDKSLRDAVNYYVVEAMDYYYNGGGFNSNPLTELFMPDEDGNKIKGIRLIAVQEFIQDHTELVLTKKKDGTVAFLREAKEGFEYKKPEQTWYDYSNKGDPVPVADLSQIMRTIKGYVAKLEKGLNGEGVTLKGKKEDAKELLAHLSFAK